MNLNHRSCRTSIPRKRRGNHKQTNNVKVAEVIPIFKQSSKMNCSNYRPISLLSSFSKIFEKIVYKRIYSYILKFQLLSPYQFGFQCSVSTYVISAMYDDLLSNADKKYYSCCLFLGLSKEFDTVDHNILLRKMSDQFGIRGLANKFFESYLSNCFQYMRLNNSRSKQGKNYLWGFSRVEPRPAIVLDVYK